jgi:glycosyltransferase involved in cell wall biosynthesis
MQEPVPRSSVCTFTQMVTCMNPTISIIIPARNEADSLARLLPVLVAAQPDAEIIVVNDGSNDGSAELIPRLGATVISHPYSMGNGAAIKTGARAAQGEVLVFMDADGQHDPADIHRLLSKLDEGYDMVVGARTADSQANVGRSIANSFYNKLASWMVGHHIADLTSGFRVARASKFREYLHMLPNGFSYPTTITMAFFRAGYPVSYVPITAHVRSGMSHIRAARDGIRFLLIIFRVGTLYSPLKIFFPVALLHFFLGIGNYMYTYITHGRFTNMSAVLLMVATTIFLIGLISEQITNLLYSRQSKD